MDQEQMEVAELIELALASTIEEISMMDEDDRVQASLEGSGAFEGASVRTFADAGVLTRDRGLVVRLTTVVVAQTDNRPPRAEAPA
jgi:hypothetical protein